MGSVARALAIALLVVIGALVATLFYADRLARRGVEQGATAALGADTRVGGVSLGLFSGRVGMSDLRVANPQGFDSEAPFLHIEEGHVEVQLASLLEPTVHAPRLGLRGIHVLLESRGLETNYGAILDHLKRTGAGTSRAPRDPDERGKEWVIQELVIEDVHVRAQLSTAGGHVSREVTIPQIRLADVGSRTRGGVLVSELSGLVVRAILTAAAKQGVDLPHTVLQQLRGQLPPLGGVVVGVGEAARGVGSQGAEELLEGAGRAVEEGAGRALRGLLGKEPAEQ